MRQARALPGVFDAEHDQSVEAELVAAARADPAAFGILYQRYLTRVYRYLRARTGSDDDAADLAQQVFLRALAALPAYRERGLPFAAWLFRIARNLVIDAERARRREPLPWDAAAIASRAAGAPSPEAAYLREEELAQLRLLVSRLDPARRELLELRYAGGLSVREIAAVVGKREGAVRKQIERTLRSLKEHYDAH